MFIKKSLHGFTGLAFLYISPADLTVERDSSEDIYPDNKVCNESLSGGDSWPPVTMSTQWWNLNI